MTKKNRNYAASLICFAALYGFAAAQYKDLDDVQIEIPSSPVAVPHSPIANPDVYRSLGVLELTKTFEAPVITALATTTNGSSTLVATAGDDHLVRIWDPAAGKVLHVLQGHSDWVRCAQFTRDGKRLVTAGTDGRVLVWNAKTGKKISQRYRSERSINAMKLTEDESKLLLVGFDAPLQTIDFESGKLINEIGCPCRDMRAVAISEDGQWAAGAGRNGKIWVWSIKAVQNDGNEKAKTPQRKLLGHRRRVRALAFIPYSQQLVSAGDDRTIRVWDIESGQTLRQIHAGPARVMSMTVPHNGPIATGGSDNMVRLWDRNSGSALAQLTGHTGSVAALSSDGNRLYSAGFDTTVRIWSLSGDSTEPILTVKAETKNTSRK